MFIFTFQETIRIKDSLKALTHQPRGRRNWPGQELLQLRHASSAPQREVLHHLDPELQDADLHTCKGRRRVTSRIAPGRCFVSSWYSYDQCQKCAVRLTIGVDVEVTQHLRCEVAHLEEVLCSAGRVVDGRGAVDEKHDVRPASRADR